MPARGCQDRSGSGVLSMFLPLSRLVKPIRPKTPQSWATPCARRKQTAPFPGLWVETKAAMPWYVDCPSCSRCLEPTWLFPLFLLRAGAPLHVQLQRVFREWAARHRRCGRGRRPPQYRRWQCVRAQRPVWHRRQSRYGASDYGECATGQFARRTRALSRYSAARSDACDRAGQSLH